MIAALASIYKGIRFRSRLESRWAAFFDEIGEPWEYEPEGFVLDGLCYLPDFFLPSRGKSGGCFAEVKPTDPDDVALEKARRLARGTGHPVMFLVGQPRTDVLVRVFAVVDGRLGFGEARVFERFPPVCPAARESALPLSGSAALPPERTQERDLVRLMLLDPAWVVRAQAQLTPEHFRHPRYRAMAAALFEGAREAPDPELAAEWERLSQPPEAPFDAEAAYHAALASLRDRPRRERLRDIDRLIPLAAPAEKDALMQEKLELLGGGGGGVK